MTGTKLAHSTLPNRYSRIKALNTEFTPDEDTVLLQTKVIVEDTFEKEKWNMIHKAVEARLGRKVVVSPPIFLSFFPAPRLSLSRSSYLI